ncbi:MAG: xanthine phosphoribosyltransferase [Solobacterium sp.]|nr:xanthine phosphoribosyltransferase [Solobacterium sp.]
MKQLKDRIRKDGRVLNGDILKVDSFLNHQIDVVLLDEIGREFKRRFEGEKITKVLTIEASGIAIACMTARHYGVPVVFAKKARSGNIGANVYTSVVHSFTYDRNYDITVSKQYLSADDSVLIVDDFMANGQAMHGLIDVCEQAGAKVAGIGIVIEKGFQDGGRRLREKGYHLESLAIVEKMDPENGIVFREQ